MRCASRNRSKTDRIVALNPGFYRSIVANIMSANLKRVLGLVVTCLLVCGCTSSNTSPTKTRLSIATGNTGGVYYPYGGGIAKIITEYIPNVEATAEVTAASVDNLKFVRDHMADLALTTADTLADAVNGTGVFEGGKIPVRALAVLYNNYLHVVVSASSPIKTLADLKGKVVSTGAAGSGTEIIAFRTLQAAGVDPERDIQKQSLGINPSADALKDGKIDAFFWAGGLPTAGILDLAHTPGVQIRLLSTESVLSALQQTYGQSLYTLRTIPPTAYPGMTDGVPVLWVPNILIVHEDMPEQLAHDITKTLFDHKDELVAIHPEARNLALTSAVEGSPAPFHPGAILYYKEQNAWLQ
jgi:uncharacterized protein